MPGSREPIIHINFFESLVMNTALTNEAFELIARRFKTLSDPNRLKIINTLGSLEMNVNDLVLATGMRQSTVSRHLAELLSSGIVSRRRDGLNAIYRVTDETIFAICDLVCSRLRAQYENHRDSFGLN